MAIDVGSSQSRKDPGWKYNYLKNLEDKNTVTCKFCHKDTKARIFRAKLHHIVGDRNVKECDKCPKEVKEELKAYIESQKSKKSNEGLRDMEFDYDDDEDDVVEISNSQNNKRPKIVISKMAKKQKSNVKGPLDIGKMLQTSNNDACDKEMRGRTIQKIVAFFYQAGVAFNVANLDCFKEMIAAVGNYGPHLKPPSYHELRVPLLKNEVEKVDRWVEEQKPEWSKYGCSIMSDGWANRKQRTLINFLVNSSKGTAFMESVDASSYMQTGEKVFELLDGFFERIGEDNVVQIITDNSSNFKLAGQMLMDKEKSMFWTPCAAQCLDLMLEDIGKIKKVKATIEKGVFLVG
ncbi:uncharacterized protein LOC143623060 [Bidens hawaiensis]|uniref:uncharacterized protein LOC143623060 n=1 Tax=Bidens hawaiensis TaxID=980011 RepID=UPI0040496C20